MTTVDAIDVPAAGSYALSSTTRTKSLVIGAGGAITVPSGTSLTITVNGVETAQKLTTAAGTAPSLAAGTYTGDVLLTVAKEHLVTYGEYTFPFRQAVYVDDTGVVVAKSVPGALLDGTVMKASADKISLTSSGDAFNGVFVGGGSYTLNGGTLSMTGNGRSDFCGFGAAVMGSGAKTTLVLDGTSITTKGRRAHRGHRR